MGYLSVSFTYGVKAVHGGLPAWTAVLISLSNLTSAGQFAGTTLMIAGSGCIEIAATTFVINLRYMLMSLSLSQKIQKKTPVWERCLFGFGITDEVFAVASSEEGTLSSAYMYGLISLPIAGWTLGTALGAVASDIMPEILSSAMELGLYAMFIAIMIPPAKKSRAVLLVIVIAAGIRCLFYYLPLFNRLSDGLQIIIAAIAAAAFGALLSPVASERNEPKERNPV